MESTVIGPPLPPGVQGPSKGECKIKIQKVLLASTRKGDITISANWWGAPDAESPVAKPSTTATQRGSVAFVFPIKTRSAMMQRYLADAVAASGDALHLNVFAGGQMVGICKMNIEIPGPTTLPIVSTTGKVVGRVLLEAIITFKPEAAEPPRPPVEVVPMPSVTPQPPRVAAPIPAPIPPPAPPVKGPHVPHIKTSAAPTQLDDLYTRGLRLRQQMTSALHQQSVAPTAIPAPYPSLVPVYTPGLMLPEDNRGGDYEDPDSASDYVSSETDEPEYRHHHDSPRDRSPVHHHHGRWELCLTIMEAPRHHTTMRFTLRLSKDVATQSQHLSAEWNESSKGIVTLRARVLSYTSGSAAVLEAWIPGGILLGVAPLPGCFNGPSGQQQHHLRLRDPLSSTEVPGTVVVEFSLAKEKPKTVVVHQPPPLPITPAVSAPVVPSVLQPMSTSGGGIVIHPDSLILGKVTRVEVTHTPLGGTDPTATTTITTLPPVTGPPAPFTTPLPLQPQRPPYEAATQFAPHYSPPPPIVSPIPKIQEKPSVPSIRFHVTVERIYHLPLVACRSDPNNAVPPTVYVTVEKNHKSPTHFEPSCNPEIRYSTEIALDDSQKQSIDIDVYHSQFDQWLGVASVDVRLLMQQKKGVSCTVLPSLDGYYHIRTSQPGVIAEDGDIIGQMKVVVNMQN